MSTKRPAGFMRRDEDSAHIGVAALVRRQMRELAADLRQVQRRWGCRSLALFRAVLAYHWSIFRGSTGTGQPRSVVLRAGDRSVRCVFRDVLSDLFVLREIFVQQVYDFPYDHYLGSVRRIVDLGSNVGLSPLYFNLRFPRASLVCVEPAPECAAMIRRNRDVNGFRWQMIQAAVAPAPGTATLFASRWSASNSTTAAVALARASAVHRPEHYLDSWQLAVPAITISSLLASIRWDEVDILKIDIEGAEEAVLLRGDSDWLDRVNVLVLDIHHKYVRQDAIIAFLSSCGFERAAENGAHSAVFLSPRAQATARGAGHG